MVRLFIPLPEGESSFASRVRIDGERFHYLTHVLRLRVGDALEVFDGRGRAFAARVLSVGEDAAELALSGAVSRPAARRIVLVQGLPKGEKFEWTLEKATELNVSGFFPVLTERGVVKTLPEERMRHRRARWQRIVEEAARQCGRSDIPTVEPLQALMVTARALVPEHQLLVLDLGKDAMRLGEVVGALSGDVPLALVVGSEGGLSPSEVLELTGLGGLAVGLGEYTLRTETAGLAALAVLRHREGLLG